MIQKVHCRETFSHSPRIRPRKDGRAARATGRAVADPAVTVDMLYLLIARAMPVVC